MSLRLAETVLAAALAGSGTLTLNYPAGSTAGDYTNGGDHRIVTGANDVFESGRHFTVAFNAASFVITWLATSPTLPVGTKLYVQLNQRGASARPAGNILTAAQQRMCQDVPLMHVRLGSPVAAAATQICLAQAIAGASNAVIAGALAIGGVAVSDANAGRGVQVISSSASDTAVTVTIRGYDFSGAKLTERLTLNGTTAVLGVKTFMRVTQVAVSAVMVGNLSVGFSNVLGLPFFLGSGGLVIRELVNGAVPTAGTFVAGNQAAAAIITGADVRGTYTPNGAPNGTSGHELLVLMTEPTYLGQPQFSDF